MAAAGPRLGVLGGSFDPPHLAHLAIASEAAEALRLERVLFVPAAAPPHKDLAGRTAASLRLEMTRLAVRSDPRFVASGIEIDEDLVYTRDTLAAVSRRFPGRELVFILGSDSLLDLDAWRDPEEVLRLASLAVAVRQGDQTSRVRSTAERWGAARIMILDAPRLDISSSGLRARVADGRPIRYLVPDAVEEFVVEQGLYRRP